MDKLKTFDEAWLFLEDKIEPHPDASDLYPGSELKKACAVFFELGKLIGLDRHNEILDEAFMEALREVRATL